MTVQQGSIGHAPRFRQPPINVFASHQAAWYDERLSAFVGSINSRLHGNRSLTDRRSVKAPGRQHAASLSRNYQSDGFARKPCAMHQHPVKATSNARLKCELSHIFSIVLHCGVSLEISPMTVPPHRHRLWCRLTTCPTTGSIRHVREETCEESLARGHA